jgi:hypothetical protein
VVIDLLRGWMVFRDPPAHSLLRDPCEPPSPPAGSPPWKRRSSE